jgi:hypothetical protein
MGNGVISLLLLFFYLFQHVFVLDHASIVLFPNKILLLSSSSGNMKRRSSTFGTSNYVKVR